MMKRKPVNTTTIKPITNLFTLTDIAKSLGISRERLEYHQREGYIERPTQIKGSRLYYTLDEAEQIRRYWLGL
jgi:hypothetical protein